MTGIFRTALQQRLIVNLASGRFPDAPSAVCSDGFLRPVAAVAPDSQLKGRQMLLLPQDGWVGGQMDG